MPDYLAALAGGLGVETELLQQCLDDLDVVLGLIEVLAKLVFQVLVRGALDGSHINLGAAYLSFRLDEWPLRTYVLVMAHPSGLTEERLSSLYEAEGFGGEKTMRAKVVRELIDESRVLRSELRQAATDQGGSPTGW